MNDFKATHWALLDLTYEYLDDGYKIIATTDVPCHLYCRMTTTPPVKRKFASSRRGIYLQGDFRFCFVVYEDNEQVEAGDTLIHTFIKDGWPICETRWFYFVGEQSGVTSVSETAMFKFHFPGPPPPPPPPMARIFYAQINNRTIRKEHANWTICHDAPSGSVRDGYGPPYHLLRSGSYLRAGVHHIWRSFLSFNTSAMAATAKLVSAFLSLYSYQQSGPATSYIYITQGVQQNPVIPTDYGAQLPYTIVGGSKLGFTPGQYHLIDLNAAGLEWINPGGITRFCLRGNIDVHDIEHAFPYSNYLWYHSTQKGAGYRPVLTVYYYPA